MSLLWPLSLCLLRFYPTGDSLPFYVHNLNPIQFAGGYVHRIDADYCCWLSAPFRVRQRWHDGCLLQGIHRSTLTCPTEWDDFYFGNAEEAVWARFTLALAGRLSPCLWASQCLLARVSPLSWQSSSRWQTQKGSAFVSNTVAFVEAGAESVLLSGSRSCLIEFR